MSPLEARRLVGHPDAIAPAAESPAASDIVERLIEACNGHPHAKIVWPHRVLRDAALEIVRLRSIIDRTRRALDQVKGTWVAQIVERALKEGA